jgi:hypothetical protein
MEPSDHGLKPLKTGAQVNFFLIEFDFSQVFCPSDEKLMVTI